MSKTGQWVFEMQEWAPHMTREDFIKKYGKSQVNIWEVMNGPSDEDIEFARGDMGDGLIEIEMF